MDHRYRSALTACVVVSSLAAGPAVADIDGFTDFSDNWEYNQSDNGTPADFPDADTIHITNEERQNRSIFHVTRQNITEFSASFTFRAQYRRGNNQHGITFCLQNDPDGPASLGIGGPNLGYGGITNSAAISFEIVRNRTGFFTGGNLESGLPIDEITLGSGHDIDVTLQYSGDFLHERLVDTVTGAEFTVNHFVGDITEALGSGLAYVGFTASTSGFGHSDQYISGFRFSSVIPAPGASGLLLAGFVAAARRRR